MTRMHRRFFLQTTAAAGAALMVRPVFAKSVNEKLNVGFIGTGGRCQELLKHFGPLENVRIAAFCDADEERVHQTADKFPGAKTYTDLRKLLEDKDVDAVAIATCNHWHALAAIWAMQHGKDVYVEKPLSHNHWEGQQVVNAARKYDRIVQLGTQQRSDPMQAQIKEFIHDKKQLGKVKYVQVCRLAERKPIGKRSTPLEAPKTVDYNLWLGPAKDEPLFRDKFHYDWHWDYNTGNGEFGNWGVHVLDDALNVGLLDKCPFPKRVASAGGRVLWNDAGNTPNVAFTIYDTGSTPLLFGMTNLADPDNSKDLKVDGVGTGYAVVCEGGRYEGGRGSGTARDSKGKVIRKFKGDSGDGHQKNFVEAVFAHDRKKLHAEIETGHRSTAYCNLADAVQRAGAQYDHAAALSVREQYAPWGDLVELIEAHLKRNGINPAKAEFRLNPSVEYDAHKQKFVGEHADKVNPFLKREYRKGFEVPDLG